MVTKITDITVNPVNSSGSLVAKITVIIVVCGCSFMSRHSHLNDNEGVIDNSKPLILLGLTKNLKLYIVYNSITVYYYI